jgi:protein CpxP
MSKSNEQQSESAQQSPQSKPRRRFLTGLVAGGLFGSLLGGGIGIYAQAQQDPSRWFPGGHGPGGFFHHAHDPEMLSARIEFATSWILSRVDATEEQRQQVKAIVQATVRDLAPLREQHLQNRQTLLQTLAQPNIDRATLGNVRHRGLQLADTASDRIVATLADIAEVLTPEQRSKLVDLVSRWHR